MPGGEAQVRGNDAHEAPFRKPHEGHGVVGEDEGLRLVAHAEDLIVFSEASSPDPIASSRSF